MVVAIHPDGGKSPPPRLVSQDQFLPWTLVLC